MEKYNIEFNFQGIEGIGGIGWKAPNVETVTLKPTTNPWTGSFGFDNRWSRPSKTV